MGLSQVLGTAVSGLQVAQSGLSLVASNIANADTPGYVRKTLLTQSTTSGGTGVGVQTVGVARELDQYIQSQLRTESSGGAYADLRAQFYDRLQDVYGDPTASTSLVSAYTNFTTALQTLSANPGDATARAQVLSTAQLLTQNLNSLSSGIQGLRSDAEQGIASDVRDANTAMQGIAQINQQLSLMNLSDPAAAALQDQRDAYVDQLSKLMDVKVSAGPGNELDVYTSSGLQLVGATAGTLSFDAQGTMTPSTQWTADPATRTVGTITLAPAGGGGSIDLIANNAIRSGEIAGYLEMRDKVLPQAQAQLDQLAASMSQALSDQTTAGTAVNTGAQSGFDIDVGDLQAGSSVQISYTDTATGTQHTVTAVRVDDPSALPLTNTATANPNDTVIGVDWSGGLASVVSELNAALGPAVQISNPAGTTLRVLDGTATDITAVSATATATSLTAGGTALPFFTDGPNAYTGAWTSQGSEAVGLAGRIAVNPALLADPSKLVAYQATTASGDSTRPDFIYDQLMSASVTFSPQGGIGTAAAPYTGTLPSYVQQIMSQQGDAAAAAKSLADGQDVVVNALQQRFNDNSGVNIDQEMSNLLTLQTAYGANARVMSAVKDMMDKLLDI